MGKNDFESTEAKIVTLVQNNNIDTAILLLNAIIANEGSSPSEVAKALVLRAECNQLKGNIAATKQDILTVNPSQLSDNERQELNLLHIKIQTQSGDFDGATKTLMDYIGDSKEVESKGALWRGSLSFASTGDIGKSEYYSDMHRERIQKGGFQEANNVLYTQALAKFVSGKYLGASLSKALDPVLFCEDIYSYSNIDFAGKAGSRIKSRCQAMLLESVILFEFGNYYDSFVKIILTGNLLREIGLVESAEGIGEIVYSLFKNNKNTAFLYKLFTLAIQGISLIDDGELKNSPDYKIICRASLEAANKAYDILTQTNSEKEQRILKIEDVSEISKRKEEEIKMDPILMCHSDNEGVLNKLKDVYRHNALIPFIGAGLSAWAYPLWSALLIDISREYGIEKEICALLQEGKYEEAASVIEEEAGDFDFRNSIKKRFPYDNLNNGMPSYLEQFPKLWKGIIITTNFDQLIEKLYSNYITTITPHSDYEDATVNSSIQANKSLLIKIHGDIDDIWNIVLTKKQYDLTYGEDVDLTKPIPKTLSNSLSSRSLLFMGCSLHQDRTMDLLLKCSGRGYEHYALVALPKETENIDDPYKPILKDENGRLLAGYNTRRKELSSCHINRIWYPYGHHEEALEALFKYLSEV